MYLYVLAEAEVDQIECNRGDLNFIIIGKKKRDYVFSKNWQTIMISNKFGYEEILFALQEIFDKYLVWYQKMLWMIANKEPLQKIFEYGIELLDNPIAMFDKSWTLMVKGGKFPSELKDPIWLNVLQTGYTSFENIDVAEQMEKAQKIETATEPFLETSISGEENAYLVATLFKDGKRFAAFGSVNLNSPFTKGQISITDILKKMIETAFLHDDIYSNIADGVNHHVNRLLKGISIDEDVVSRYLARSNRKIHDNYVLLYFELFNKSTFDIALRMSHAYRIDRSLKNAYIAPYEDGVIAIIHADTEYIFTDEFRNEFSKLMEKFNLACGVSMQFSDFMNIKNAYIQAKTAIKSTYLKRDVRIYDFIAHYVEEVVSAIGAATEIKSMCHPKILQLAERDDIRGRELIHTLYMYLLCGRNTSSTAKLLHVHRNTLGYRLNMLGDFLGEDINELDENTMLLLLISCLILNNRSQ